MAHSFSICGSYRWAVGLTYDDYCDMTIISGSQAIKTFMTMAHYGFTDLPSYELAGNHRPHLFTASCWHFHDACTPPG